MRERRRYPRATAHAIDAPTIPRLNAITDRTGAKIVISSTWRRARHPEDASPTARMRRILGLHGATGDVIGVTPSLLEEIPCANPDGSSAWFAKPRGLEIQAWLDAHPEVTSFVILDDNSDMAYLGHRLVQTTWERGLQDEHVAAACALFGDAMRGFAREMDWLIKERSKLVSKMFDCIAPPNERLDARETGRKLGLEFRLDEIEYDGAEHRLQALRRKRARRRVNLSA